MPPTTAFYSGLSALTANARWLDVIGNNIANVNTPAFKSSRVLFGPVFQHSLSLGTAPRDVVGGTNPSQVGHGVNVAAIQRNFSPGAINTTGSDTDFAVDGNGFFIVNQAGEQLYTRAGAFQRDSTGDLVTISGGKVMGYAVDSAFQVIDGELVELNIPIGSLSFAQATNNIFFNGNLNAAGLISTKSSEHLFRQMFTDQLLLTPLLSEDFDLTIPGNDLFISDGLGGSIRAIDGGTGTTILIEGAEKDGKVIPSRSFAFSLAPVSGADTIGTTIGDFMDFLEDVFGLDNTTVGGHSLGGNVSLLSGVIAITGNKGQAQNLTLDTNNFIATVTGTGSSQPFVVKKVTPGNGESARSTITAYDSLGVPVEVDVTFVLQEVNVGGGTTWQFIAESSDSDTIDRVVGTGILEFDSTGKLVSDSNLTVELERLNGASTPLSIQLDFTSGASALTSVTSELGSVTTAFQDGAPIGTLSNFAVGENGVLSGMFTNGLTRTIGQIALASFSNPEGLVDVGDNLFRAGANSGQPLVATPGSSGTGQVLGGALELSNVDLSQEFIDMILAETGYSAASRVITTTDELIQRLLLIGE